MYNTFVPHYVNVYVISHVTSILVTDWLQHCSKLHVFCSILACEDVVQQSDLSIYLLCNNPHQIAQMECGDKC